MVTLRTIIIIIILFISNIIYAQLLYDDLPEEKDNDYTLSGYRFNFLDINYYFASTTSDLDIEVQKQAIRDAFDIWCVYTPLKFTEVFSSTNAHITILWATGYHGGPPDTSFDGTNRVLAHAFFPYSAPHTGFSADMHYDDDETWTVSTRPNWDQPIDLVTVAAHEIGHTLGLNHSANPDALMYKDYFGSHRYLHQDDIDGIKAAYNFTPFTFTYTLPGTLNITDYRHYKGQSTLQTSGSVTISGANSYVSFKALNVILNPGFQVSSTSGSYFLATTDYLCGTEPGDEDNYEIVMHKENVENTSGIVLDNNIIPTEFSLSQNFPNPFNPFTTIEYTLPLNTNVSLKVYNLLGKEIANLVNEYKQAGYYNVNFDATSLASGVYIYRMVAGDFVKSYEMVIVK